jgi:hypothetical protein
VLERDADDGSLDGMREAVLRVAAVVVVVLLLLACAAEFWSNRLFKSLTLGGAAALGFAAAAGAAPSFAGADTDRAAGLSPALAADETGGCLGVVPLLLDLSEEAFGVCLCAVASVEVDAINSP